MSVAPMRRKEPILGYVPKDDEKKNLVHIGLISTSNFCKYIWLDTDFSSASFIQTIDTVVTYHLIYQNTLL